MFYDTYFTCPLVRVQTYFILWTTIYALLVSLCICIWLIWTNCDRSVLSSTLKPNNYCTCKWMNAVKCFHIMLDHWMPVWVAMVIKARDRRAELNELTTVHNKGWLQIFKAVVARGQGQPQQTKWAKMRKECIIFWRCPSLNSGAIAVPWPLKNSGTVSRYNK